MAGSDPERLYTDATDRNVVRWNYIFEPHPDGGVTPSKPEDRGNLDVPCPHCGEIVVRRVSAMVLARSQHHCEKCGQRSFGARLARTQPGT